MTAILAGQPLDEIQGLITNDNINSRSEEQFTPLMLAARAGRPDVAEALLDAGCDINAVNEYGDSALHIACLEGHENVAVVLCENDAEVNGVNVAGYTPAMCAATGGYLGIMNLLHAFSADFNFENENGDSAYSEALRREHIDVLRFLCEQNPSSDACNSVRGNIKAFKMRNEWPEISMKEELIRKAMKPERVQKRLDKGMTIEEATNAPVSEGVGRWRKQ